MGRTLTIIAIALAVATTTISVTMSVYFSTTAKATAVASPAPSASPSPARTATPPPALRDYWTQAHAKVQLGPGAKRIRQVLVMMLPAGHWVLHAELSVYNSGPSDFVGCVIGDAGTASLNGHRTIVGDPTRKGNVGPAPLVALIAETAAVTVKTSTRFFVKCEHDTARGASPYIDPGADLWAHQSAYLVKQGA